MIDAHAHLWLKQAGKVGGLPVYDLGGGKSQFGEKVVQMLPPYMTDGINSAERFLANMDFAQVGAAVITQEYIDGNQDDYLKEVRRKWPERFRVTCLYEENGIPDTAGADGIKICGGRLQDIDLTKHEAVFRVANERGLFIAIDMADGDAQVGSLREMIQQYPDLRIAIGHFGMVTRDGWEEQIRLARNPRVFVESGGITWLFNDEFYPFPSAVRAIREAADEVGVDKLMWGSDYPRTITAITYKMSYDFITKSPLLTDEEKAKFLGENARRLFGFGDLPIPKHVKNMSE